MRKTILILLSIIGLGLVLSPLVGGILAQRVYESASANIAEVELGTGLRIDMNPNEYKRGLLRSQARTDLGMAGDTAQLQLTHSIFHGPLPYQRLDRGPAWSVIETTLDTRALGIEGPSPLELTTTIDLDRDLHVVIQGTPVNQERFDFEGATGAIDVSEGGRKITGDLDLTGIRLLSASPDSSFTLHGARAMVDLSASDAGLPVGSAEYALGELEVLGGDRDLYVRNLGSQQTSAIDATSGMLASTATLRFDELRLGEAVYAAGDLKIEARNLNAQAMAQIRERQRTITDTAELWGVLQAELPQLIEGAPEIEVSRAVLETPGGSLDLYLRVRGRPEMAKLPLVNLAALLNLFDLELRANLAESHVDHVARALALARAAAQQREPTQQVVEQEAMALRQRFIDEGYLSVETTELGTRYATTLDYRRGALTLNQRPLNPNALVSDPPPPAGYPPQ